MNIDKGSIFQEISLEETDPPKKKRKYKKKPGPKKKPGRKKKVRRGRPPNPPKRGRPPKKYKRRVAPVKKLGRPKGSKNKTKSNVLNPDRVALKKEELEKAQKQTVKKILAARKEEDLKTPAQNRRPRNSGRVRYCYEFEECREIIQNECLDSSVVFKKWWDYNMPSRIPRNPHRAYKKEWKGYNDFLGTNNEYPTRKRFRSYAEAKLYAHGCRFRTDAEWREHAKTESKPEDIPSRPDVVYKSRGEWISWKDFLGYDLATRAKALNEADVILFVAKSVEANNVYIIGTVNGTASVLSDVNKKIAPSTILKAFYIDRTFDFRGFIGEYGRPYEGSSNEFFIPNILELFFELESQFERI